ncbi:hypothetical protein KR093_000664, partial [Drosophila rubida]
MSKVVVLYLLLATSSCYGLFRGQFNEQMVNYLTDGTPHVQEAMSMIQSIYSKNDVHIYCRNGDPLKMHNVFQSVVLHLSMEPGTKYSQYRAGTPQAVHQAYLDGEECHEGKLLSGAAKKLHYIRLPSHAEACYGIYTNDAYNLTMQQYVHDGERSTWFGLGLVLWMAASLLSQCHSFCNLAAITLAVHFAGLAIICAALMWAGDYRLKSLQPVGLNFKLVLESHTTMVALTLVFAAWLQYKILQANQSVWRLKSVQVGFHRLMKLIAYGLVLYASDHKYFGWICVGLMLPQPELFWVFKRLRDETVRTRRAWFPPRGRNLLTDEEFEAQTRLETRRALSNLRQQVQGESPPRWEQMANLQSPCRFVRFVGSGDHPPDENAD